MRVVHRHDGADVVRPLQRIRVAVLGARRTPLLVQPLRVLAHARNASQRKAHAHGLMLLHAGGLQYTMIVDLWCLVHSMCTSLCEATPCSG